MKPDECTCGGEGRILETRPGGTDQPYRRRRYQCLVCEGRWTTKETRADEPSS